MSSGSSHYALENKDFFINIWNSEKNLKPNFVQGQFGLKVYNIYSIPLLL
jgi:hypothetical protein